MYLVIQSHRFKKSYKKLKRSGHFDEKTLRETVTTLSLGKNLEPHHRDHQLHGDMAEYRECHVKNDLLLIYSLQKEILILLLVDIGSHSELF